MNILRGALDRCVTHQYLHASQVHARLDQVRGVTVPKYVRANLFADTCLEIGEIDEGFRAIEEGLACVEEHDQARWEPELHRLRANLMLRSSPDKVADVERSLYKALNIAKRQGAKSWELRAAIDLARLLETNGRAAEAQDLLRPIFDWFNQGFDTFDLMQADALLKQLN